MAQATWDPTFVTPQDDASVRASIDLICPTADIQSPTGTGVFPIAAGFARIQNRDGTFGFPARNVLTGNPSTTLQARIYDDNEDLVRDILVGCGCPSRQTVASLDSVSFTGYWGLEVTGQAGTLFRRMSNASQDNLSFGTANTFNNR